MGGRAQLLPPRCIRRLCICSFFCVYFLSSPCVFSLRGVLRRNVAVRGCNLKKRLEGGWGGRAQRLPPRCIRRLCICCFFCVYFLSSPCVFSLRGVLRRNVAVRGCNLKKRLEGGWGGRAQRLPPRCIRRLCICCFFCVYFLSSSCVFSSWRSSKQCGSERMQP